MSRPLAIVNQCHNDVPTWVSMDAFLSQCWSGQWVREIVKYTSVMPSCSSFIIERICRALNCLVSDVMINWPRATLTAWIMAMIILQRRGSMSIMHGLGTELINTLRPGQNGRHFADDVFKCIFLDENEWISLNISLKFVPTGPINNIPLLVQIMAWRRPGDKPLSEPMMVILLTHIRWVKNLTIWSVESRNYIN